MCCHKEERGSLLTMTNALALGVNVAVGNVDTVVWSLIFQLIAVLWLH